MPERKPQKTALYLDTGTAMYLKVIAALNGTTLNEVVKGSLVSPSAYNPDEVRRRLQQLVDRVTPHQVHFRTRPSGFIDGHLFSEAEELLVYDPTLGDLFNQGVAPLTKRLSQGCSITLVMADPSLFNHPNLEKAEALSNRANKEQWSGQIVVKTITKTPLPPYSVIYAYTGRKLELALDVPISGYPAHEWLRVMMPATMVKELYPLEEFQAQYLSH